ncbi:MAG: ribbon-helix-helix domain-containing protein [Promethearchaeota archaeon]
MRNTSIHLPELYLKLINEIISEKEYPCLSEFVRIAIRKMLKKDLNLLKNPLMKQSLEKLHKIHNKDLNSKLQKKIDQYYIFLKKSIMQEELNLEKKTTTIKQTRIDKYWK